VLGILLIVFLPMVGAVLCAVLSFTCIVLAMGFSWYAFTQWHLLLDPAFPSIVVLLIYLVSSFFNFLRTETERGQIRSAFSRYLSPHFVTKLTKDPKKLKLGGEIKIMSFLFTDIRNFTSIAETMTAEELTRFMNSFMTPMTEIILKHNGTIDKYIGDCIMAFWNAPIEDKNHARNACEAGLEMLEFLKGWNLSLEQEAAAQGKPFRQVHIGIGINTGEACVGNMGSEYRFDYTVLGDEVNLASRLEGLTKQYSVSMLLGQNTAELVPDLGPRELDTIQVRGKTRPTKIYSLS
jgi:adenylate cyclase